MKAQLISGVFVLGMMVAQQGHAAKEHRLSMSWEDESAMVDTMDDHEFLTISLPAHKGSKVTASFIDQETMVTLCEVKSIKVSGNRVLVRVLVGETNRDDGWNGCTVEIKRNHPNDEDGLGIVTVQMGYSIDD